MESFPLREADTGLHIKGVPDAVKVVRIDGANAQRLVQTTNACSGGGESRSGMKIRRV
jgi:hypothetical protein